MKMILDELVDQLKDGPLKDLLKKHANEIGTDALFVREATELLRKHYKGGPLDHMEAVAKLMGVVMMSTVENAVENPQNNDFNKVIGVGGAIGFYLDHIGTIMKAISQVSLHHLNDIGKRNKDEKEIKIHDETTKESTTSQ